MANNLSMPLMLVSGNRFTRKALVKQLKEILPNSVKIFTHEVDDGIPPEMGTYFVVFSSQEVYREFAEQNTENTVIMDSFVVAERTMLNQNIDRVLSLPRNQRVLLVNESEESTFEAMNHMKKIGFDFLHLVPYYPGCPLPEKDIKIAVTPGEIDLVPPGIKAVYNIGPRSLDFSTIVRILTYYGLLEDVIPGYADRYLSNLLDFAKKLSIVADETSRVLSTVRTELLGTGYYAKYRFSDIIGHTEELMEVKAVAEKLAHTNLSVLIEGENGTGKELLASAIHNASDRYRKPFVAINLSALPDELIESELFGYEEGAFTGAKKNGKIGLFQQAAGGTIFLDEIGDISLKMQAKLLRVLQEHQIMRVGGDRIIPVDVRIIAATNRNLKEMMEENTFRKDLYYRLREGYLHMPSLKSRREDIPLLIDHWQEMLFRTDKKIAPDALELLMKHEWPGNVRELLNLMKFTFAVCEKDIITAEDLPFLGEENVSDAAEVQSVSPGTASESTKVRACRNLDEISKLILTTAAELQEEGVIVGRGSIIRKLEESGHALSEYRVRKCLQLLREQDFLKGENGAYGLTLTAKAHQIIINRN